MSDYHIGLILASHSFRFVRDSPDFELSVPGLETKIKIN